jgi:hypothetical protein
LAAASGVWAPARLAGERAGTAVGGAETMQWLQTEAVALAGPAYVFLQLIMAIRYRRRWRLAALVPLLLMLPLAVEAGFAYRAEVPGWPTLLVLVAPAAFLYLLLVAVLKGWLDSRGARG